MRIKKSLTQFKVLILLFGFTLYIFMPVLVQSIDTTLRSNGQLFLSVDSDQDNNPSDSNSPIKIFYSNPQNHIDVDASDEIESETKGNQFENAKQDNTAMSTLSTQQTFADKDMENKEIEEKVRFNFENVDLANVVEQIKNLFDVTFISDESIKPIIQGGKGISGNKVSFKTNNPLSKKQVWNVFVTFLDMAGLYLIPQADPKIFRISTAEKARRSPIKSFINVDPKTLPDNDTIVRYGYFVKDCPLDTIRQVLETLKSSVGQITILNDHNAFILTDSAYNIKVLMKVVKELDKVTMPQTMSVLRLHKVEAKEVKELYDKLTKDDQEGTVAARLFGPKKPSRALYFPKNAKIIPEERTNSLILLGTNEAIQKIENFVTKYVDIESNAPYSPLFIYDLKYADAINVANIMRNLIKFGQEGERRLAGAIRAGDKYFKKMTFTAEPENNRLIIRGNYDDYQKIKNILDEIDEPPVQVSVEILIMAIDVSDRKDLGAQLRNKFNSPAGQKFNFQTSGITMGSTARTIAANTNEESSGALRLLGDLINLVSGSSAGTTAVSLGSDKLGVWGIFGIFNEITNTQIVANPFLTATNNSKAKVQLGETRRVKTQEVTTGGDTTDAFGDYSANITVTVRPTVNSDGMIVMKTKIEFDSFLGADGGDKNTRTVDTTIVAANNEIIALGGLLRERQEDSLSKVPVLGNIPIFGWLFKNKVKRKQKEDLLVLITSHIVEPGEDVKQFTKRHIKEYKNALQIIKDDVNVAKDPIDRSFFKNIEEKYSLEDYIFTRGKKNKMEVVDNNSENNSKSRKARRARRTRKKKNAKKSNKQNDKTQRKTQKKKKEAKERRTRRSRKNNKKVENPTLVV